MNVAISFHELYDTVNNEILSDAKVNSLAPIMFVLSYIGFQPMHSGHYERFRIITVRNMGLKSCFG